MLFRSMPASTTTTTKLPRSTTTSTSSTTTTTRPPMPLTTTSTSSTSTSTTSTSTSSSTTSSTSTSSTSTTTTTIRVIEVRITTGGQCTGGQVVTVYPSGGDMDNCDCLLCAGDILYLNSAHTIPLLTVYSNLYNYVYQIGQGGNPPCNNVWILSNDSGVYTPTPLNCP